MLSHRMMNRARVLLVLPLVALVLAGAPVVSVFAASGAQGAAQQPVYVGVPSTLNATYFQELRYVVILNGKPVPASDGGYGWFNDTFTLTPQPYTYLSPNLTLQFPFQLNIYNVHVSRYYNSTFAGKRPPQPILLTGSEYAANYSIPPYFIISPNAPSRNYTSSQLHTPYLNMSVIRLSSYSYSYGNISFNGPAIEQISLYQPPPTSAGSVIVKNQYFYDAKSGLLIYWTNTTLFLLSGNSSINITSSIYLIHTNLKSINPAGTVSPLQPAPLTKPSGSPISSASLISPVFILLIVVVVILVVLVVVGFTRRR